MLAVFVEGLLKGVRRGYDMEFIQRNVVNNPTTRIPNSSVRPSVTKICVQWILGTFLHSRWKMWGDGTLQCSRCVGHMAWAPEGREGREAGPKGRNLEVGARRAPRLLVWIEDHQIKACKMKAPKNYYLHNEFNSRVYKLFTGTLEQLFVFFSCWSRVCRLIRVSWRRLF